MTDKLREAAKQWVKDNWTDLDGYDFDFEEAFEAGAHYQAPITRQETIAEVLALLRENFINGGKGMADWLADWLAKETSEESLRAMEGEEK